MHPDHVALADDEHRHVGEQMAVDRPPDAGHAVEEAGPAADHVVEAPVRSGRVEAGRCGGAVGEEVDVLLRPRARRRPGSEHERGRPAHLDARTGPAGRHDDLQVGPAPSRDGHGRAGQRRRPAQVRAVDGDEAERRAVHPHGHGPGVAVDHPDPDGGSPGCGERDVTGSAVDRAEPVVEVHERDGVGRPGRCGRGDHHGPEQAAQHLLVRHLVGVVPERPDLGGAEAVGERAAHRHGVLRDPGDAVVGVGDVDPVPVHRDAVGHGRVHERHLHALTLPGRDHGSR